MKNAIFYSVMFICGSLTSHLMDLSLFAPRHSPAAPVAATVSAPASVTAAALVIVKQDQPCPPDTIIEWVPSRCVYNRHKFKIEYSEMDKAYIPRLRYSEDLPGRVYLWDGLWPGSTLMRPEKFFGSKADCIEYINIWEDNLLYSLHKKRKR